MHCEELGRGEVTGGKGDDRSPKKKKSNWVPDIFLSPVQLTLHKKKYSHCSKGFAYKQWVRGHAIL